MRRRSAARATGDSGAVLAEAALVLPIVLFSIMGLFDLSLLELKQSQLASAARDGARKGSVNYVDAQTGSYSGGACPSSPASFAAICSSVTGRLAGATVNSITARCYVGLTTTPQDCTVNNYKNAPGATPMTIVVSVTSSFRSSTYVGQQFLGRATSLTASARMVIQ